MTDRANALSAIRSSAMELLSNALFVERELPNVSLPPELRARTAALCGSLVGTKHDVLNELDEYDELVASGAGEAVLGQRVARMVRWLGDDVAELDAVVRALEEATREDERVGSAYVLVAESAANVLRALARAREAACAT